MTAQPAIAPRPSRENAATKARRLLTEGRIRIQSVRAGRCWATVNGETGVYDIGCSNSRWHCTCPAFGASCSHIKAVQLVVDLSGRHDHTLADQQARTD